MHQQRAYKVPAGAVGVEGPRRDPGRSPRADTDIRDFDVTVGFRLTGLGRALGDEVRHIAQVGLLESLRLGLKLASLAATRDPAAGASSHSRRTNARGERDRRQERHRLEIDREKVQEGLSGCVRWWSLAAAGAGRWPLSLFD